MLEKIQVNFLATQPDRTLALAMTFPELSLPGGLQPPIWKP